MAREPAAIYVVIYSTLSAKLYKAEDCLTRVVSGFILLRILQQPVSRQWSHFIVTLLLHKVQLNIG
jgi:hypothetical protein